MKYLVDKKDKYTLIRLDEDKLDATISPELKTTFVTYNAEGTKSFLVDLNNIKYVDSSGLSSLLIANRLCKEASGTFVMTGVSEHVMKLIKISQLDKVLNILPTLEEAIDLIFLNELENDLKEEAPEEEEE